MLTEIINYVLAVVHWDIRLSFLGALLLILVATRALTTQKSWAALKQTGTSRIPPIVPYSIPLLGNMLDFVFGTVNLIDWMRKTYGPDIPVRFRIMNRKIHYISGADNLLATLKNSRDLTADPTVMFALENAFGSPASASHVFMRDQTGSLTQPLSNAEFIEPHNRIFHIMHKLPHKYLNGRSITVLAEQTKYWLHKEIADIQISEDEWAYIPDFYHMAKTKGFTAFVKALCGPHIFELNPDFASDFWEFDSCMPNLFRTLPRWMIPRAFRVRDKLLRSIVKWHAFAAGNFDTEQEAREPKDWEEFYGARIMRERHREHRNVDDYNDTAIAANDLGMLWAAHANSIPGMAWMILDIVLRPSLHAAITLEIQQCKDESGNLDITKLLTQTRFQAVYSETLRVRVAVALQRIPIVDGFKVGPWKFPRNQMILASTWHEHHDNKIWNEGPVNGISHPVDEFWAERFLVFPNDPNSGPRRPDSKQSVKARIGEKYGSLDGDGPVYTTEPVQGSFLPYGWGEKMCPGRFLAKYEMMIATALFLDTFDFDFDSKEFPRPNMAYFPFGVVPPLGKFPVRMKRRSG